jgi:hypothetical protein
VRQDVDAAALRPADDGRLKPIVLTIDAGEERLHVAPPANQSLKTRGGAAPLLLGRGKNLVFRSHQRIPKSA